MGWLLRCQAVAVARAGVAVLERLDLELEPGKAVILQGPNGVGKTTLLRCLAGLQPPMAGRIEVAEEALVYSGHADGLKSTLTVAENLGFWAAVYRRPAGLEVVLDEMALSDLRNRPAAQLSAGQKRRLGLARLLLAGRPVWLLDEPTVSLDAASVQRFAGVVARHLGQGGAVLAATHIDLGLGPAAQLFDLEPYRARSPRQGGPMGAFDEAFL